jgi:hypothetical protein
MRCLYAFCGFVLASSWWYQGIAAAAQGGAGGRLVSEHVRMSIPVEREWLGRDTMVDLERCWRFMHGATGNNLPRRVLVVVAWDGRESRASAADATVTIGMTHPAAAANMRGFLLHEAAREMARLGLLQLARRNAPVETDDFLFEGMAEILTHEFDRSSRSLAGAWVLAHLLDRINLLGLTAQSSWSEFSGGRHDLRSAAPGITFLLTCRETFGRERTLKLFEGLRRGNLNDALWLTFRTSAAALEGSWLKKVREHSSWEDVTTTSEDDAPILEKTVHVPETARAGQELQLRFFVRDKTQDLFPGGIYVQDQASGKVFPSAARSDAGGQYISVMIPVSSGLEPGQYNYKLTAVDEAGNVRTWDGAYPVK